MLWVPLNMGMSAAHCQGIVTEMSGNFTVSGEWSTLFKPSMSLTRLSWPGWLLTYRDGLCSQMDTHPSTAPWECTLSTSECREIGSSIYHKRLGGSRVQERTGSTKNKLDEFNQKRSKANESQQMSLNWEEVEVAAVNRKEWWLSLAQCIQVDVGWVSVKFRSFYICKSMYNTDDIVL